jgi:hypothetical protein
MSDNMIFVFSAQAFGLPSAPKAWLRLFMDGKENMLIKIYTFRIIF